MQEFNVSLLCGSLLLFSALAGGQPKVKSKVIRFLAQGED